MVKIAKGFGTYRKASLYYQTFLYLFDYCRNLSNANKNISLGEAYDFPISALQSFYQKFPIF